MEENVLHELQLFVVTWQRTEREEVGMLREFVFFKK